MIEIWEKVKGYDNYFISNLGRIKSVNPYNNKNQKSKILKPTNNGNGYMIIRLCENGTKKNKYLHRLVAETFLDNPNNFKEINHKDNNKSNNNVNNLEWCDRRYNVKYSFTNGYHIAPKSMLGRKGKEHPISKPVKQYDLDGNFIKEYGSASQASEITGICYGTIKKVRNGKGKTAGGFIWV